MDPGGQRARCPGSVLSRLWPVGVWLGRGCSLVPRLPSLFPLQPGNLEVLSPFFREWFLGPFHQVPFS